MPSVDWDLVTLLLKYQRQMARQSAAKLNLPALIPHVDFRGGTGRKTIEAQKRSTTGTLSSETQHTRNALGQWQDEQPLIWNCNWIKLLQCINEGANDGHTKLSIAVNSKLDWNDNLAAIFEAKLVIKFSPFLLFLSARLTPFFWECTDIWCFYFDLRGNFMVYELIT